MTHFCRHVDENKRIVEHKFSGDCLEAIGIPNRGVAVIDINRLPKVGDLVHCTKMSGAQSTYMKQVFKIGDDVVVGTRYLDKNRDFMFNAADIYGVVIKAFDDHGNIIWDIDKIL